MAESKKPRRTRKASTSKTTKAAQTRQDTPDVVALTADSFVAVDQKQIVIGAATEITSDDAKVLTAVIAAGSEEGPGTIPPPSGASTGPVGWDDITDKPTEFPPEDHTHKIQDAEDYHKPFEYAFDTFQASANPNEPGEYHFQQPGIANNLAFAKEDANGAVTEAIKNLSIGSTIYLNGVAFTTKSAGGSFSGGGSVGSWFIGITEDLSAFDTSGGLTISLEAPIADGDILQWDNTDQKFKPAQLETGASSWNDLTDKPTEFPPEDHTHQIQDASDFALQPAAGVPLNNWSADNTPGPGEWNINNQFLYLPAVDSNGADQRANLRALAGQTLTITDADGTDWLMTNVSIIDELDGGHERILLDSAELETIDAGINKTGGIELTSAAFTVAELPLAEGDHLQWDATAQAFKPVQLTDEVGISRIQDASDFELNPAGTYRFTLLADGESGWPNPPAGQYTKASNNSWLRFPLQDADGKEIPWDTSMVSIWTTTNLAGSWTVDDSIGYLQFQESGTVFYIGNSIASSSLTVDVGAEIWVAVVDPNTAAGQPLAEGDFLRFDGTNFRPHQLETGASSWNDLTDKPTEFPPEAHTHTASEITDLPDAGISRIQDASDYKPQPLNAFPHDFRWSPKTTNGAPATGEWGTNQLRFSPTDADGTAFNTTGSTQMWLSPDASAWQEVTAEIKFYPTDSYYYISTADIPDLHQQIEDEAWASLYLNFTDPDTVDLGAAPLAEGDVLQWDNTEQAFRPVQLTDEVGISRIQDASDYRPNQVIADGSLGGNRAKTAPTDIDTTTGGFALEGSNFIIDHQNAYGANEYDDSGWLSQIVLGSIIVVTTSDGTEHQTTVQNTPTHQPGEGTGEGDYKPRTYFQIESAFANAIQALSIGEFCQIGLGAAVVNEELPLVDGDLLRWNAEQGVFKPTQPAADEVGITRIQDASDFALNQILPTGGAVYYWTYDPLAGQYRDAGVGGIQPNDGFQYAGYGYNLIDELVDVLDWINDQPAIGETFWFKYEGGEWEEYTKTRLNYWPSSAHPDWDTHGITGDRVSDGTRIDLVITSGVISAGDKMYMSWERPLEADPEMVPLADGDTLRWDASQFKFRPAQLDGGSSWLISGRRSGGLLG